MWWPSFLSVLHDLWLFCTRQTVTSGVNAIDQQLIPNYQRDLIAPMIKRHVRLQPGMRYTADHPDTIQIRDQLSAYDAHITATGPLTPCEWLLYNAQIKRLAVPLVALRLSPLGRWHTTLKGQPGINIGITPYTDALMEWKDEASDRVGWVKEVSPDETIVIGELGQTTAGLYETTSLTRSQWLELRPIFTIFI